jgi:nicotinamide riboside kinase
MGAECTGKTQLAQALAEAVSAHHLPEVLRGFCEEHQRPPLAHEQAAILMAQLEQEQSSALPCVVDCPPLTTAIYSLHYFGDAGLMAKALDHHRSYNFTLFCAPDLPWQADGFLRDGPAVQAQIDAHMAQALTQHQLAHARITGRGAERLQQALRALRHQGLC